MSVVVVTYEPDLALLRECVQSVAGSDYRPLELVVVDNGSNVADLRTTLEGMLTGAEELQLRFSAQGRNLGYAAATNRGLAISRGELVLLLNPDARVEPSAITTLVVAAAEHPEVSGFAPKILLADPGIVIDSVGMALHPGGEGSQRGLGQVDLGQYDLREGVSGLCFAATMIRRAAWSRIGALDERFFMFYEDVDWSLRAQVLGERFSTVPAARVFHFHSASTRHLGQGFKTRLIQRNLIWTAVKNLETRRAVRVVLRRTAANLRRGVRPGVGWASLRALVEAWAGLPGMVASRREIQARRRRRDRSFMAGPGEATFFDADTYQPQASVEALLAVLARLYALAPDAALERTLLRVQSAHATGLGRDPARIAGMVRAGGVTISPPLEWLLRRMEGQ